MPEREFPTADEAEREAVASRERAAHAFDSNDGRAGAFAAVAQADATLALVARVRELAVVGDYIADAIRGRS